jgi:hypothetical protein
MTCFAVRHKAVLLALKISPLPPVLCCGFSEWLESREMLGKWLEDGKTDEIDVPHLYPSKERKQGISNNFSCKRAYTARVQATRAT